MATTKATFNVVSSALASGNATDGYVLTADGSGNAAWEEVAGGPTFKTFGTASLMIGSSSTGTINAADYNTAVSTTAFAALTTGDFNVAFGEQALDALTTGGGNTALGVSTLGALTTANNNTAVGISALTSTTSGTVNTAVGSYALDAETTGSRSTALGYSALTNQNFTSNEISYNTAVGYTALNETTTGGQNTAVGYIALYANTTGTKNTAVGFACLDASTTGYYNTAVGKGAGGIVSTGAGNTLMGGEAGGTITTSNNNTVVGQGANISSGTSQGNEVVLGQGLTGIGYHQGILGGVNGVYNQPNTTTFAQTSDERIKKNIEDYTLGLDTINNIRVRTFEYRELDEIPNGTDGKILNPNELPEGERVGVIAQEIIDVLPSCVTEHENSRLSVTTDNVLWTLVKAVQELSVEVETLKSQLGN